MKSLVLLLALLPLAKCECPPLLLGLDDALINGTGITQLGEVVDAGCGRRNFTSAFWSPVFYQQVIGNVIHGEHSVVGNYLFLKPVYFSLKTQLEAINNKEAKSYINDYNDMVEKTLRNLELNRLNPMGLMSATLDHMRLAFFFIMTRTLSIDAQVALSQTFKRSFGWHQTGQEKKAHIRAAMNAIERVGALTQDEKLGELFANVYLMARANETVGRSAFEKFAIWAEKEWNSTEIGYLEVVPAVEILYLQYVTLKNQEAKALTEMVIGSLAWSCLNVNERTAKGINLTETMEQLVNETRISQVIFKNICPSSNITQCFDDLPAEARIALTTTFPELFEYVNTELAISHWEFGALGKESALIKKVLFEAKERSPAIQNQNIAKSRYGTGRSASFKPRQITIKKLVP